MKVVMQHDPATSGNSLSPENRLFPVFLKLEQLRVLIVGGGTVASEKLNAVFLNAPLTDITLVGLEVCAGIQQLAAGGVRRLAIYERAFRPEDLEDIDIVIIAVRAEEDSAAIVAAAKSAGKLVNAADKPGLCDFYLGAIVTKGNLKIAVSTNGLSPTVAKRIRDVLQESIPEETNELLLQLHQLRNKLSGDFAEKVRKLNHITRSLDPVGPLENKSGERKWRKVAYWCFTAFVFLFLGNLIASFVTISDIGKGVMYFHRHTDPDFYWMLLAGFIAQLIDGALGMGFGVTCTSVLLSVGIPLPAISSSIHTAEIFSSGASGFSHYRFGNVNKKLFRLILIPGILGAIAGAWLLSTLGQEYARYMKPALAVYTLFLGLKILLNAFKKNRRKQKPRRVGWLAGAGGFLDSFGGGGWGPLVTSTLLSKGKTPKYVIGTVSLTEFFVTLASAITFFSVLGIDHWQLIMGLVIGSVIAAPLAARLAGKLPVKTMFFAIGTMIIIWSLNILIRLL